MRPISKRRAREIARRLAYEAVQKAVDCGGEEQADHESQVRVESALDEIAQRMFNRLREKG